MRAASQLAPLPIDESRRGLAIGLSAMIVQQKAPDRSFQREQIGCVCRFN
jgi:hypothetical protein